MLIYTLISCFITQARAVTNLQSGIYTCETGYFLPANSTSCKLCLKNNVCPGSKNLTDGKFTFNKLSDQGIYTCSSLTDGEYPYSDVGTEDEHGDEKNDVLLGCYKNIECPIISDVTNCDPHAVTCAYTKDSVTSGKMFYFNLQDGRSIHDLKCSLDFTCAPGYKKSTSQTPLILPNKKTDYYQFRSHERIECDGDLCLDCPYCYKNTNTDNDLSDGEWKVIWTSGAPKGTIKGIASCNDVPGNKGVNWDWSNNPQSWTFPVNTDLINIRPDIKKTSRFCWCKPT